MVFLKEYFSKLCKMNRGLGERTFNLEEAIYTEINPEIDEDIEDE